VLDQGASGVIWQAAGVLILGVACALAAVAWIYLLAGHGGFWRTDQRLPGTPVDPARWPDVVAVVPARDEAGMLPVTLPTLLGQDYPGLFEVVLVDDGSTDGTGEIAAALGREAGRPLRVVAGSAPPEGWAGKVWAMAQGLEAVAGGAMASGAPPTGAVAAGSGPGSGVTAREPSPASPGQASAAAGVGGAGYVLFTDADIAWQPGALRALVAAAEGDERDLVSQMARLRTETAWERVVVPAFVYFFAQLYPFRWVNRAGGRTAAAAGGCMLVRRSALAGAGGIAGIRGALIDDVALARLVKHRPDRTQIQDSTRGRSRSREQGRCWLGLSAEVVSVRPYPKLADLWHMIARSAYTQLRYSPLLLAGTIFGLLFLYAVPPVGAIVGVTTGSALTAWAGVLGWILMSVSYLPMLRFYRLSPLRAPGLPLVALMYAAMTIDSARRYYTGDGAAWKGRTIERGLPSANQFRPGVPPQSPLRGAAPSQSEPFSCE
jgi:hopene-associated glycosyltransferase HpnB